MQVWINAMRPRTLPLALASIGMGAFLAASNQKFNLLITLLCILTTIFLQILSNLANDYGDSIHGADSAERTGPQRAVQSGQIMRQSMWRAMLLFALLAIASGISLVWLAFGAEKLPLLVLFLLLGAGAIWAAVNYTAGRSPYGYMGLGDLSVLLFFGWLGVCGTYYLQTGRFLPSILLPATSSGLFAVAVLNVNNVRDLQSDRSAGKRSIPVRIGREKATIYHWALLVGGLLCALLYVLATYHSPWQFLFLLITPLLVRNGLAVRNTPAQDLDPFLKQMALTSLLFMFLFGVGQIL